MDYTIPEIAMDLEITGKRLVEQMRSQ